MRMPVTSRIIFIIVSVFLAVGAHLADFNETHIFNPKWMPHAKFHGGHTLMFSIFLAVLTIYFAFRKTTDRTYAVLATAGFAGVYWITQAFAILYPGTWFLDPEFESPSLYFLGVPLQLVFEITTLTLIGTAAYLAMRKNARWVE